MCELLVYDISRRVTFQHLISWLYDARNLTSPETIIMLIGSKRDLDQQREVSYEEAAQFARDNGLFFSSFSLVCNSSSHLVVVLCDQTFFSLRQVQRRLCFFPLPSKVAQLFVHFLSFSFTQQWRKCRGSVPPDCVSTFPCDSGQVCSHLPPLFPPNDASTAVALTCVSFLFPQWRRRRLGQRTGAARPGHGVCHQAGGGTCTKTGLWVLSPNLPHPHFLLSLFVAEVL